MEDSIISQLQKKNKELSRQAYYDDLTGVLNRRATERKIKQLMEGGGAYIIGDLDCFKRINDNYGHLEGDRCLRDAAGLLKKIIRQGDILGRIGGDEFVLFLPGCYDLDDAKRFCQRIGERFISYNEANDSGIHLSISVGVTMCQEGDTYQSLYHRADQSLIQTKNHRRKGGMDVDYTRENWVKDVDIIHRELIEEIRIPGAFCQSYEQFRGIYRFLERCMRRNNNSACIILFSMADGEGQVMKPANKAKAMEELGGILRSSLRMGDVYTRYSSCQYLVLVIDTDESYAEMIARRIEGKYNGESKKSSLFVHCCYRLQAAKLVNEREGQPS